MLNYCNIIYLGDYMTKMEMEIIKQHFSDYVTITKEELLDFIVTKFEKRKKEYFSFYVYDMQRINALYQLNKNCYKLSERKQYDEDPRELLVKLYRMIRENFEVPNLCIWELRTFYGFLVHQPMRNVIFVEVPSYLVNDVYKYLQFILDEVIILSKDERKLIKKIYFKELVFVVGLHEKAPVKYRVNNFINTRKIGFNSVSRYTKYQTPKIEKVLVELFLDKYKLGILNKYEELVNVFTGILETYQVNMSTLAIYAKNRYIYDELFEYLSIKIKFCIETGEFYDR